MTRAAADLADDDLRQSVWSKLHRFIARHRGFSNTSWALPPDDLARLDEVAARYAATDAVDKHRWLFDSDFPETGHPERDFAGREADLTARRQAALTDVFSAQGWSGIGRLVREAKYPHIVGRFIGLSDVDSSDLLSAMDTWCAEASDAAAMAVRSASGCRRQHEGDAWTQRLVHHARQRNWPAPAIATALLDYPLDRRTLDLIAGLPRAVQRDFWSRHYAYIRDDDVDDATARLLIERLVEHERALDVIDVNRNWLKRLGYTVTLGVLDAAIGELAAGKTPRVAETLAYDLEEVFDWLRSQPEFDVDALARREWPLLPILVGPGGMKGALALHRLLARDPGFFLEVLCALYRPATASEKDLPAVTESERNRANAAFDLLHSWKNPPGLAEGAFDAEALNAWVDHARSLAAKQDRRAVADIAIGRVLHYVPPDPDDELWPHVAVRELLERLRSADIESGLECEVLDPRGVHSRGLQDGGAQERELEAKWLSRAAALGARWPRARRLRADCRLLPASGRAAGQ